MRRTRTHVQVLVVLALGATVWTMVATGAQSASAFADPQFKTQWDTGEAIAANFWGPLPTSNVKEAEPYKEATPGGTRLVQYFDKGRMELTNGKVTNGLLATEITKGLIQTGDATFEMRPPPAIPVAGDPDGPGPTYAGLATKAVMLFTKTPKATGGVTARVAPAGDVTMGAAGSGPTAFSAYDDATQHNVPTAFADYRTKASVATIGLAITEPFIATVKVGGKDTEVMAQVFERRVLTYTASNPEAFRVEMGNIGAHYYQWRYKDAPPAIAPAGTPTGSAAMPTTGSTGTPASAMGSAAPGAPMLLTPPANLTPPADITGGGAVASSVASTANTVNTKGKTPAVVCSANTLRTVVCK